MLPGLSEKRPLMEVMYFMTEIMGFNVLFCFTGFFASCIFGFQYNIGVLGCYNYVLILQTATLQPVVNFLNETLITKNNKNGELSGPEQHVMLQ